MKNNECCKGKYAGHTSERKRTSGARKEGIRLIRSLGMRRSRSKKSEGQRKTPVDSKPPSKEVPKRNK